MPLSRLLAVAVFFLALAMPGRARADKIDDLVNAMLTDPSHKVRAQAAIVLGQLGNPRAVQPLIEALRDPADTVRGTAAASLGRLGDKRAVAALQKLKTDASTFVRQSVAKSLGELAGGGKSAPPPAGAKFYIAVNVATPKAGGAAASSVLKEAILDEIKRLPKVTVNLDGPPTAPVLASHKLTGWVMDTNITSLKAAGGQLDCDVSVSIATLPGHAIKARATAGASVNPASSVNDPGAQRDCFSGAAQQLAEELGKFLRTMP